MRAQMQDDAIRSALADVRRRIDAAARFAHRDPAAVRLVAVSKQQSAAAVAAAFEAGQRDFGENYVQELVAKARALGALTELRWHVIGHLPRNKAKDVAPLAAVVHSVDRVELVEELERRVAPSGRTLDVLVQVNVAGEAQKSGCHPAAVGQLLEASARASHLRAVGLMTMPPLDEEPEHNRRHFAALRELRELHGGARALPELSMGMSGDFEVAVSEGATLVRIGTAIFGARS